MTNPYYIESSGKLQPAAPEKSGKRGLDYPLLKGVRFLDRRRDNAGENRWKSESCLVRQKSARDESFYAAHFDIYRLGN